MGVSIGTKGLTVLLNTGKVSSNKDLEEYFHKSYVSIACLFIRKKEKVDISVEPEAKRLRTSKANLQLTSS